mmetsp:Transcript_1491/g.3099  ORF Transcript_1491/g.3099 Transcript_1491/m.3099 type:complete len:414 (-) Transcript_1491:147-1388(-)|eukprot:CAMPEP_0114238486 /NCGR_PEP_ID=MMETSP0058-20121206/7949_1 /TAXON_ID=36894 /ORGANISM="Pyramimonas parkeae, CCMP726" /LENGTH=413 /DNA_ID=CAMNT_0001350597 /DNA_START=116 /DNA_END=1357 /DNA_ORIENTATION=+
MGFWRSATQTGHTTASAEIHASDFGQEIRKYRGGLIKKLFASSTDLRSETVQQYRQTFASGNAECIGSREEMQDVLAVETGIFPNEFRSGVFCVFDGHGGDFVAKAAAMVMPSAIISNGAPPTTCQAQHDLRKIFDIFESSVVDNPMARRTGCTATVAMIAGDQLHVAQAGDSQAVLSRGGSAVPLSIVHSPNVRSERQRIEEAGGYVRMGKGNCLRVYDDQNIGGLAITRSLGDYWLKSPLCKVLSGVPDVQSFKLNPADEFVIVASDGLWDKVTPACAVKYLRKKNPKTPQEASQLLVRLARRRGSGDNIGVVVVFLGMDMIKAANDHVDDDVVACSSNTDTFASHFSEAELSTHSTLDDCHQCSSIASIPPLGSIEDLTRLELESHAGGDSDQDNESPPSSGCVLDPELG